jgi:integrase
MARRVRDSNLESKEARFKLKPRAKAYWRAIDRGLHVGFRRLKGKPGTWIARHYLGERSYRSERIGTADDMSEADGVAVLDFWQAQKKAREHMVRRAQDASNGTVGSLTVRDAVTAYIQAMKDDGRDTTDARSRANAHIYSAPIADVLVCSLTSKALKQWHTGLAKASPLVRGKKGATKRTHRKLGESRDPEDAVRARKASANRTWTVLRAALNHAFNDEENKIASAAPWQKVKPFKGVDKARVDYLEVHDAKRLVNACEPHFRLLVQAALQTGARYGQLAKLVVSDFNLRAGTVRLRTRKGSGKEKVYHATLSDEGVAFFRHVCAARAGNELMFRNFGRIERAMARERERLAKMGEPVDNIRVNDIGDWRESEQLRPMADAVKRARIKPPIGFHGLRHTWASHAVMNGMPLLIVAKNLGHSDTRMVEKHYGHLAPDYVKNAIRDHAPKFGIAAKTNITPITAVSS